MLVVLVIVRETHQLTLYAPIAQIKTTLLDVQPDFMDVSRPLLKNILYSDILSLSQACTLTLEQIHS